MYLRWSTVAVALLCLAAGCAELRWHRSGSDFTTLELDLSECRRLARADAAGLAWPFPGNTVRLVAADRAGRPVITPYPYPTWLDTDRLVLESELVGACMRKRGYSLAPAETSARP